MSIIAYINGDEIATKDMIPGNGINLLDGTKTCQNFVFDNHGEIQNSKDNNLKDIALTSVIHTWGDNGKLATIKNNQTLHLIPGNYTLSFIICGNNPQSSPAPTVSVLDGTQILGTSKGKVMYQPTFISINFRINQIKNINLSIQSDADMVVPGGSIWYANFKLEAGVNPTPWSESPTDQIQELKSSLSK